MRIWHRNWTVFTASMIHGGWSVILLFSEAPLHTTPMSHAPSGSWLTMSVVYFLASILGLLSICPAIERKSTLLSILLALPQQYLVLGAALMAVLFASRGHYPDGYVPADGGWFILADQLPFIALGILHTASVVDWYWFSRLRVNRLRVERKR